MFTSNIFELGLESVSMSFSPGDHFSGMAVTQTSEQQDELRTCIQNLVRFLDESDATVFAISSLSRQFKIKRRRLYDIINIFEAIGFCKKTDLDTLVWTGRQNLEEVIREIGSDPIIYNPSYKLEDIFPCPCSVGVSSLATCFLKMFFALSTSFVDLRLVSQFLSRDTMRYRTTLCKMYQIAYVLTAIDVTSRTAQVGIVALNKPYSDAIQQGCDPDPTSLLSLLNRQGDTAAKNIFQNRQDELRASISLLNEKRTKLGSVNDISDVM